MVAARTLFVGMAALLMASAAQAAEPGRVVIAQGNVTVVGADKVKGDLSVGDVINQGDIVEVGSASFARLMMEDGSVLDLSAGTRVAFRTYSVDRKRAQRKASMKVFLGRMWARVAKAFGSDDNYTISSDNAVAGVRGTVLVFEVHDDGRTQCSVVEGSVAYTSKVTQLSELLGGMTRGTIDSEGQITRDALSDADLKALEEGAEPKPKLDSKKSGGRLNSVRERLGVEVTPTDDAVELPVEEEGEEEDDLDGLDDLEEDPSDPLIDLEPDAGTTRVRGTVEVVEP